MSNGKGRIGLETVEFCDPPTSVEITEPAERISRSVKKPVFRHQFHGNAHRITHELEGFGQSCSLPRTPWRWESSPESTWNVEEPSEI